MEDITTLGIKRIEIMTVAKVASSTFLHSLDHKYKVTHGHDLSKLKVILKKHQNTLIIGGIRNPLDRNISYFFQNYHNNRFNTLRTKANKYVGENCYLCPSKQITKYTSTQLIKYFFKNKIHFSFNDWLNEFMELTNIKNKSFNKAKGMQLYKLPNNNYLLFYTFEKLNKNTPELLSFFKIDKLLHTNNSQKRVYKKLYNEIKKTIKFTNPYKNRLLKTNIMNFFYTQEQINIFNNKYK